MTRGNAKAIAAGITVAFIALIRPETQPQNWFVAALAIEVYECAYWIIAIGCREARRQKRERIQRANEEINRQNAQRLEEERLDWPMTEVRA